EGSCRGDARRGAPASRQRPPHDHGDRAPARGGGAHPRKNLWPHDGGQAPAGARRV
ncbi:MAG: NLP/P60 family lipoprotein, partial [uncultured Microvirga sp.]